jgi:putative chitinase
MAFINTLYNFWPNGDQKVPGLRDGIANSAQAVFAKYGINTPLLVAHVMAQISHECGAGHDVVENLSYSAQRLIEVWPRHFNSSNAAAYAHNPEKLANFIYNPPEHKDLGNRAGSSDGSNYRGRGACQTTGRANYEALMKFLAKNGLTLDLLSHPELVNDPRYFLECGVADFILCGCLPFAKADDVLNVTGKLNGGTVGLAQRQAWLAKWKAALGSGPVDFTVSGKAPAIVAPTAPSQPAKPAPSAFGRFVAGVMAALRK